MFGCCGFLSFSLVFCLLGGRFETALYIHFTRRWVISTRHSSALRRKKRGGRGGKSTSFFAVPSAGLGGVCGVYQQVCPVDGLRLAYDWTSPLWRRAYTASLTAARHHVSVPGVGVDTAPFTTSAAPISANMSGLRRVRSSVSRSRPTPYACTSVRLPPPPSCP